MTPEKELELFEKLGDIKAKVDQIDDIKDQLKSLPCEARQVQLGQKVSWRQVGILLGILLPICAAILGFTYNKLDRHVENPDIHNTTHVIEALKE